MATQPGITFFVGWHGPKHYAVTAPFPEAARFLEDMAKHLHRKLVEGHTEFVINAGKATRKKEDL